MATQPRRCRNAPPLRRRKPARFTPRTSGRRKSAPKRLIARRPRKQPKCVHRSRARPNFTRRNRRGRPITTPSRIRKATTARGTARPNTAEPVAHAKKKQPNRAAFFIRTGR
ncbi:hypothetical protein R82526_01365 [Ralstonia mannitolilytica]|nr:hypothetical protein R82526_01365 [Ralstonia mannitolilytica]CAJ0869245.1 hypothetical protein R76727_02265 [Ralstonia mannitolilytica]